MKKMMLVFTLVGLPPSFLSRPCQAQSIATTTQITDTWQRYFRQIRSIQFDSDLTILPTSGISGKVPAGTRFTLEFAANGMRFYAHISYPKGMDFKDLTTAYDGRNYQVLAVSEKGPALTKTELPPQVAYNGAEPFTLLFAFAFREGEPQLLTTLQNDSTWKQLRSRMRNWRKLSKDGKDGHLLTVYSDEDKDKATERYEVFVEATSGLPTQWQVFDNRRNTLKKSLTVTKTMNATAQGVHLTIPASFTFKARGSKKGVNISGGSRWDMDTQSLILNRELPEQLFILSATQIRS